MQRIIELREKAIRDEHAIYTKGIEDEKVQIAKNMLKENISIDIIIKVTRLTKEEVEKLV